MKTGIRTCLVAMATVAGLACSAPLAAATDAFVDPAARLAEIDAANDTADASERALLLIQLDRLDEAQAAIDALAETAPADDIGTQSGLALARSVLFAQRQELESAVEWARKALELETQASGANSAATATMRTNLGRLLISQGAYEEGLAEAGAAWEQLKTLLPAGDSTRVDSGFQYAVGLVYARQAVQAEALLRELLGELAQIPGGHAMRAKLPQMLGTELLMQGRSNEALPYLSQAVESGEGIAALILGERADHLSTFGLALLMQDRPEEALPIFERASAMFAEAQALPSQSGALLNAGTAADRAGDRARGLAFREQGMAIAASVGNQHPLAVALNQFKLAQSLAHVGRLEEAEAMEQAAVDAIAQFRPEKHFQNTNSRIALGWIKALRGDVAGGMALVRPAWETSWNSYVETEIAQNRAIEVLSDVEAYSQALETARLAGDNEFAFRIMQAMIESDASRAALAVQAREQAGETELGALLRQRQEAGAAAAEADSALLEAEATEAADIVDKRAALEAAKAALAALETDLDARYPGFRTLLRPRTVTIEEIRSQLGKDEALLVIDEGDLGIYTMAITRESVTIGRDPLRRQELRGLVSAIRTGIDAALLGAEDAPFDLAASARIHDAIFTPEIAAQTRCKKVLRLAVGDILSALPLSLLVSREGQSAATSRFLVEDKSLSVVPSLAAMGEDRSRLASRRQGRLVAIGAPELAGDAELSAGADFYAGGATRSARVAQLRPLPGADAEMRAAARMLGGDAVILSGADATEAKVEALDYSGVGVLLFATHGLVAGAFDERSEPALVLTPPERESGDDDGLLTASEASRLDIDADWVILSACDTAAGGRPSAAGYTGLARGFLFAGARRVVASHWQVRDDVAARLTAGIVAASRKGRDPAAALRSAILSVKKDKVHPAFWAPFMVIAR